MYKFEFTKEEVDAAIIQLGCRLDELKLLQKEEAKNENVQRVIELEEFMKPIRSFYEKLLNRRYEVIK
jgi:hypothetical protein